jgi:hypothetical protein
VGYLKCNGFDEFIRLIKGFSKTKINNRDKAKKKKTKQKQIDQILKIFIQPKINYRQRAEQSN